MTRDEIVVLARKSGFETELFNSIDGDEVVVGHITITDLLVEFADLVAEKEREELKQSISTVHATVSQFATGKECVAYNDALQFVLNLIEARSLK